MRLDEILRIIIQSAPSDWHHISDTDLGITAIYMPNSAIAVLVRLDHDEPFAEEWAVKFPDVNAKSSLVDVLYHGHLVYRDICVAVDGGRATLPMPHLGTLKVPAGKRRFFSLLNTFERIPDFNDYFHRAGLTEIDEPWPDFTR